MYLNVKKLCTNIDICFSFSQCFGHWGGSSLKTSKVSVAIILVLLICRVGKFAFACQQLPARANHPSQIILHKSNSRFFYLFPHF